MPKARATMDDVAARAGVSRMTVSNVYARPEVVSAATQERVLAAAAELSYGGPSAVGRTLRRGSTGVLGVLVKAGIPYALTDPGAVEFLRGVGQGADEAGLSLLLVHAAGPEAVRRVNDAAVDAFVSWSLRRDEPALVAALGRRLPIVAAGSGSGLPGVPYLSADCVGGARRAAEHLLAVGCRRFAVLGARLADEQFDDRRQGYRQALEGVGIEWDRVALLPHGGNDRAGGAAGATALLALRSAGERWGLLAMTDVLALGALRTLRHAGVRVPEEVAVVGFDGIDEAATSEPGLTTVHQDLFAGGREAALRAAGHLDGPTRVHPTTLVVRGSTVAGRDAAPAP